MSKPGQYLPYTAPDGAIKLVQDSVSSILEHTAGDGYKLAADWAQNYDPRHGNGLNGPSRGKLEELMRFMFTVEALEDEPQ